MNFKAMYGIPGLVLKLLSKSIRFPLPSFSSKNETAHSVRQRSEQPIVSLSLSVCVLFLLWFPTAWRESHWARIQNSCGGWRCFCERVVKRDCQSICYIIIWERVCATHWIVVLVLVVSLPSFTETSIDDSTKLCFCCFVALPIWTHQPNGHVSRTTTVPVKLFGYY